MFMEHLGNSAKKRTSIHQQTLQQNNYLPSWNKPCWVCHVITCHVIVSVSCLLEAYCTLYLYRSYTVLRCVQDWWLVIATSCPKEETNHHKHSKDNLYIWSHLQASLNKNNTPIYHFNSFPSYISYLQFQPSFKKTLFGPTKPHQKKTQHAKVGYPSFPTFFLGGLGIWKMTIFTPWVQGIRPTFPRHPRNRKRGLPAPGTRIRLRGLGRHGILCLRVGCFSDKR